MSDDIYKLIGRLRSYARSSKADIFAAVDTIEALRAERDRLKAALQKIADTLNRGPDINRNWDVKSIYDIAREALEAKE